MSDIKEIEFSKWVNQLENPSPHYITLLNIIISNFAEVAQRGTRKGERAHFLVEKINAKKCKNDLELIEIENKVSNSSEIIKNLKKLEVESFRGFKSNVEFNFHEKYSIFHGQNGSGKSSLCQALEYSLLGRIQEATARKIDVEKFIVNENTGMSKKPILKGVSTYKKEVIISEGYEKYRFSFIEKNPIDEFAHIAAVSPSEKNARLAALFGLSEFSEFINEFTDNFDNYLKLEHSKKEEYKKLEEEYDKAQEEIIKVTKDYKNVLLEIKNKIKELKQEDIKTLDTALRFLEPPNKKGKIAELEEEYRKNKIEEIKPEGIIKLGNSVNQLSEAYTGYKVAEVELLGLAVNQNLHDLYKVLSSLEDEYENKECPACKTPLSKTVENPFKHAKKELDGLKKFSSLQKKMKEFIDEIKLLIKNINNTLEFSTEKLSKVDIDSQKYLIPDIKQEASVLGAEKKIFESKLKKIQGLIDNKEKIISKITKYNTSARKENDNNTFLKEANDFREIHNALIRLQEKKDLLKKQIDNSNLKIKKFETEKVKKKKEVEKEVKFTNYNSEMQETYKKFYKDIKSYQKNLPIHLAQNLSSKVTEYYNVINNHDADFEKIESFELPVKDTDKIMVKLMDGIKTNALQILSEGHVKILGLAILLAKASQENLPFLIFDDIVNAIDDGHRDGVATLLLTHTDFKDTQMIITCHGEQFVKKLEDKLEVSRRGKDITRFVFLSAETLDERGIVSDYSDPKHPLELAKKNLATGSIKDAAAKCRQATECLVIKIWKKLDTPLTVQMRLGQPQPELSSLINALVKKRKDDILVIPNLNILKDTYNLFLQNKGTHEEDNQFEFEASDIKDLITLLETIENELSQVEFTVEATLKP